MEVFRIGADKNSLHGARELLKREGIDPSKTISFFTSASSKLKQDYKDAARDFGVTMAKTGMNICYGGNHEGLMGEVIEGFLSVPDHIGKIIGVNLSKYFDAYGSDESNDIELVCDRIADRKCLLNDSKYIVALPGGNGTMDELGTAFEYDRTHGHKKIFGLLNTNGFYDHLIKFVKHAEDEGFIPKDGRFDNVHLAPNASRLSQQMKLTSLVA